jgi:hypothetical protein
VGIGGVWVTEEKWKILKEEGELSKNLFPVSYFLLGKNQV